MTTHGALDRLNTEEGDGHTDQKITDLELGLAQSVTAVSSKTKLHPDEVRARHIFHYECISKWAANDTRCPLCKADMLFEVRSTLALYKDRLVIKRI